MLRAENHPVSATTIARWFAAVVLAVLLWMTIKVVLLLFGAVLLAIFLRGTADALSSRTGISDGWALVAVGVLLLLVIATLGALLAPEIAVQLDQLNDAIPRAWQDLMKRTARYEWGRRMLASPPNATDSVALVSNAGAFLAAAATQIAHIIIFMLIGIYLAADPAPYVLGMLWLVPAPRREEARKTMVRIGRMLRRWLLSRLIAMSIVGPVTMVGLWALGVPLALTLGLAAGIMTFVPYIGAFASAAPALLLGVVQSPTLAGQVLALYVAVHIVEGYLVTPLIEREAIRLPPAASIAAQAVLGTALGVLGLMLASPLTAAAIIILESFSAERQAAKAA